MEFLEDFIASLESIPAVLQKNYALMHDLDVSLQGVQRQNEQRCEQEIETTKRRIRSGNITTDASLVRFSDDALDEQKHCVRIADEKVALATQAYDMVDSHIQQLDQYMRKLEELRQGNLVFPSRPTNTLPYFSLHWWSEKELASAAAGTSNLSAAARPGRTTESRGGRKKSKVAAEPPAINLELPVDPNEPTYCSCKQVSYGEMVACDNPDCKIEWFHFGCVGLKEQPKGKWYCSDCAGIKKRRKGK